MKETDLVEWHAKEWLAKSPGALYIKIPDALGIGNKRPFDVVIDDQGKHYAIEFKLHKTHHAFSLAKIEQHQIDNLLKAQANGRIATVFIGIRFMLDLDDQERLGFRIRRVSHNLEYPINDIVRMIDSGIKSIKVVELLREAI